MSNLGYNIYVVPEAATLLFNGGVRFMCDWNDQQKIEFESDKIKIQMALEEVFYKMARASGKSSVIICDR